MRKRKVILYFFGSIFLAFSSVSYAQEVYEGRAVNLFAYPPKGERLGEVQAQVFLDKEMRYVPVIVNLTGSNFGVFLWGKVPCILKEENGPFVEYSFAFLQRLPFDLERQKAFSALELEIGRIIATWRSSPFKAWTRYALSFEGCHDTDAFRISVQYGLSADDALISVKLPFSKQHEIDFKDIELASQDPCKSGIDLFFTPAELMRLIDISFRYKSPLIEGK